MALGATINKVTLNIADMDRHYYQQHDLTVAMHPSENAFRFVIKIIAFALNAGEELRFTKGLGADDEPEIWRKSLSDVVELWIDFGQVDEKRIRKACGRADQVIIYTYQEKRATTWWAQNEQKLKRHDNLKVVHIDAEGAEELAQRNMVLQCTIDDGSVYLSDDSRSIEVTLTDLTE